MKQFFLKLFLTLYNIISFLLLIILPSDIFVWYNLLFFAEIIITNIAFYFLFKKSSKTKWIIFVIFLLNFVGSFFLFSDSWEVSVISSIVSGSLGIIAFFSIIFLFLGWKTQVPYRNFFIINTLFFIGILAFNFWYYRDPITEVDQSNFITKYENKDPKSEKNLYKKLNELFPKKWGFENEYEQTQQDFIHCAYTKKCKYNYSGNQKIIEEIKQEKLKTFIEKFTKLKDSTDFYKFDDSDLGIKYRNLQSFHRFASYEILSMMQKNHENQAIQTLSDILAVDYKTLNWDTILIGSMIAIADLNIMFDNLEIIIDNFTLTDENKQKLIAVLKPIQTNETLTNTLKVEHKWWLKIINPVLVHTNMTLLNRQQTINAFDTIRLDLLQNNFKNSDAIIKKFGKTNIFKYNILGQIMYKDVFIWSFDWIQQKLNKLETRRQELVEKLKK